MTERAPSKIKRSGPTLFRQIVTRLAIVTVVFALSGVAIVVCTYSRQPKSLAQELLNLEAERVANATSDEAAAHDGPPGADHWLVRHILPPKSASIPGDAHTAVPQLINSTIREKLNKGYRISGIRSIERNGQRELLYMQFEGDGLRPYVPVIVNEIVQHVLIPLVPLTVLMLLFSVFAVRRVLDPLQSAEAEVDQLDPDNMTLRLTEPPAPREVNTLVHAVNRALDRLDAGMTVLKTFTANAAHELRTPLSIMQLTIDRLPESSARTDLERDNAQMTRLVSQMLDLAQADALSFDTGATVDLAEIAREVVTALAPKAHAVERELHFEDRGNAIAKGHREAIYRILRNLIDNALAHAPVGTSIEVAVGPGSQLVVRDHGPGVPPEDRTRIFERFWRANRQRGDGAGLGLGIVKRLVEAHHGDVFVDDAPGGGAVFRVRFQPMSAATA